MNFPFIFPMMNFSSWRRNLSIASVSVVVLLVLMFTFFTGFQHQITKSDSLISTSSSRKLLGIGNGVVAVLQPKRIFGERCTKSDIVVIQGPTTSLPNGIPTYTVQIMNLCVSGCDISKIHLRCGWFSSARLINPKVFKRLGFNDCLVNDGKKLASGRTLSFQYANTFRYPLSVSSVSC